MLTKYVQGAMRRAKHEILSDDGTIYVEIPGFDGVYNGRANMSLYLIGSSGFRVGD